MFDGDGDLARSADHQARVGIFLADLVRPYRLASRTNPLGDAPGHSYAAMVEAMIGDVTLPDQPVDVVVLAFATPDVQAGRAATTFRTDNCPGDPLVFAVCDQGPLVGFTGLRLLHEHARTGGGSTGLLLVAEQANVPWVSSPAVRLPDRNAAVALLCGSSGAARVAGQRQHAAVSSGRVGELMRAELAVACADRSDVTLVLGAELETRAIESLPADRVRVAPARQPCTGVWWELVAELSRPPTSGLSRQGRRVVLADYDPALGYLFLCALDVGPGGAAPDEGERRA